MKRIILIIFVILAPVSALFSQIKSPRYGVEIDVIPLHFKQYPRYSSMLGFAGGFLEMNLSRRFTVKLTAGLNNIRLRGYPFVTSRPDVKEEKESFYLSTFEFIVEPRYYLFAESKPWGNLFGATRLAIETGPFQKKFFDLPTYKAIPTIGYRYNFSRHLFAEVNAGLGWSMVPYYKAEHRFDHFLGIRLGFAF
ncbi:MAG: hypothetical protein LBS04_07110 [Tannerellaceae bacterium]|jgi:hypothetical protein|nr:hypothetical protein [Tannerellaceae bacterium]